MSACRACLGHVASPRLCYKFLPPRWPASRPTRVSSSASSTVSRCGAAPAPRLGISTCASPACGAIPAKNSTKSGLGPGLFWVGVGGPASGGGEGERESDESGLWERSSFLDWMRACQARDWGDWGDWRDWGEGVPRGEQRLAPSSAGRSSDRSPQVRGRRWAEPACPPGGGGKRQWRGRVSGIGKGSAVVVGQRRSST